jgi:hypothetical protein
MALFNPIRAPAPHFLKLLLTNVSVKWSKTGSTFETHDARMWADLRCVTIKQDERLIVDKVKSLLFP